MSTSSRLVEMMEVYNPIDIAAMIEKLLFAVIVATWDGDGEFAQHHRDTLEEAFSKVISTGEFSEFTGEQIEALHQHFTPSVASAVFAPTLRTVRHSPRTTRS